MDRILVSACLMGQAVRYDGQAKPLSHPLLERWRQEGRLVSLCPEMAAGLPVPRPPAEIAGPGGGEAVLNGTAPVLENTGRDVTAAFLLAAERALAVAHENDCRFALLIDGSPSCGSSEIYDGRFAGVKRAGQGVVAARLSRAGIAVFAPRDIEALARAAAGVRPRGGVGRDPPFGYSAVTCAGEPPHPPFGHLLPAGEKGGWCGRRGGDSGCGWLVCVG